MGVSPMDLFFFTGGTPVPQRFHLQTNMSHVFFFQVRVADSRTCLHVPVFSVLRRHNHLAGQTLQGDGFFVFVGASGLSVGTPNR
jgi:hypothetical protein